MSKYYHKIFTEEIENCNQLFWCLLDKTKVRLIWYNNHMSNLNIEKLVVGSFSTNCYILFSNESKTAVIIDPGAEVSVIIAALARLERRPSLILITHGHGDHIGGLTELKEKYPDVKVGIGQEEDGLLRDPERNLSCFLEKPITFPGADLLLKDGETFSEAGLDFKVITTPGHTQGGVSYLVNKEALFCGDTLFYLSVGRTDFPGGDYFALMSSIKEKILVLPKTVKVYPGHGPYTTVGIETLENHYLK